MKSWSILKNNKAVFFVNAVMILLLVLLFLYLDIPSPFYYSGLLGFGIVSVGLIMTLPTLKTSRKLPPLVVMSLAIVIIVAVRSILMGHLFQNEMIGSEELNFAIGYLLDSSIFAAYVIFLSPYITKAIKELQLHDRATSFVQYFLSFIFLLLHSKISFLVIERVKIFNDLEGLATDMTKNFIGIGAIVIGLAASFYLITHIFRNIQVAVTNSTKILNFLLSFVLVIPLLFWLSVPIPILGFFLGSLVIFILLDLYLSRGSFDVNWMLTWVFVMGIYITSWIFIVHHNQYEMSRSNALNLYLLTALISTIWLFLIMIIRYLFDSVLGQGNIKNGLSFQDKIQLLNLSLILFVVVGVFMASFRYGEEMTSDLYFRYIRIFVMMLMICLFISILSVRLLTSPLQELKKNLAELQFDQMNKKIQTYADGKDELSQLIRAYNQGVTNIEEGRVSIAKAERETAWKEMAKQIAHEIKNPLTPMKLSLQHLQKVMENSPETDLKDRVKKLSNTFISQIENLNHIADSFSDFSSIAKPKLKQVDLNELLTNVHNLFNNLEEIEFNLYVQIDEVQVMADKNQIIQVLNNLVKNAIQAITDNTNQVNGLIKLRLDKDENKAVIRVEDNGPGIPEEIREQVFQPKFTTKNSGTGLGLPICNKIIESHGGSLHFEDNDTEGVSFVIHLPLS